MLYRCIRQDSVTKDQLETTLQYMEPLRRAQIESIAHPEVKRATVCGEWLCKTMLAEQSGLPFEQISLAREKNGKPFAQNLPLYFSISHSGAWVACAVSHTPVGIDLESIKKRDLSVAERICSPEETDFIFAEKEKQTHRFLKVWTVKEAFVKMTGEGIKALSGADYFALLPRTICTETEEYILSVIE